MEEYNAEGAKAFILAGLDKKEFHALADRLEALIGEFLMLDEAYMDSSDDPEYDEDEALEWIYDHWLAAHPDQPDDDLLIAHLLDQYMELQYRYLVRCGLV